MTLYVSDLDGTLPGRSGRLSDATHAGLTPARRRPAVHRGQRALEVEIEDRFAARVECHLADDLYLPGWFWLAVHDLRATKEQAIKTLAERYGLHEREVVVFGDQLDDVGMMRAAHRGIAMANAIDELKRHAHQVIGHHDEDSVLRFIEADWARSR